MGLCTLIRDSARLCALLQTTVTVLLARKFRRRVATEHPSTSSLSRKKNKGCPPPLYPTQHQHYLLLHSQPRLARSPAWMPRPLKHRLCLLPISGLSPWHHPRGLSAVQACSENKRQRSAISTWVPSHGDCTKSPLKECRSGPKGTSETFHCGHLSLQEGRELPSIQTGSMLTLELENYPSFQPTGFSLFQGRYKGRTGTV